MRERETPEMVARVAREICRQQCDGDAHPCDLGTDGACKPEACRRWVYHIEGARAAIQALREPTESMISARFHKLGSGGRAEWQAMIDAALAETP